MDILTILGVALIAAGPTLAEADDAETSLLDLARLEYHPTVTPTDADAAATVSFSLLDSPAEEPSTAKKPFGAEGTRWWGIQGGFAAQFSNSDNQFVIGGLGASWFVANNVCLEVQLNGMRFWQTGENANGVNVAALLRWHFWRDRENKLWSMYLDAGAGLLVASSDVPEDGSSYDFTPQAGGGMTWALTDDVRLFGGLRWYHMSNGNTYRANPGRDSYEFYAGVMFPF